MTRPKNAVQMILVQTINFVLKSQLFVVRTETNGHSIHSVNAILISTAVKKTHILKILSVLKRAITINSVVKVIHIKQIHSAHAQTMTKIVITAHYKTFKVFFW